MSRGQLGNLITGAEGDAPSSLWGYDPLVWWLRRELEGWIAGDIPVGEQQVCGPMSEGQVVSPGLMSSSGTS